MTEQATKLVKLDMPTYSKIKSNADRANRTVVGEIRQMLAILSAPKEDGSVGYNDGKRVVMVKHADGRVEIAPEFAATGEQPQAGE